MPLAVRKFLPVLVIALTIFCRQPEVFLRSEFWAEDGYLFREALVGGWRTLFTPLAGYYVPIPRLIALVTAQLPVVAAPYVYAWVSFALAVAGSFYFMRETFAHLLKLRTHRMILCFLIAIGPGTAEVFSNLCNLYNLFFLWTCLLLLEPRPNLMLFGVCLSSSPACVLLLPFIVYRLWKSREPLWLGPFVMVLSLAVFNLRASLSLDGGGYALTPRYLSSILTIVLDQFFFRFFVLPFTGTGMGPAILKLTAPLFYSVCATGIVFFWRLKPSCRNATVWPVLGVLTALSFGMMAIGRSYVYSNIVRVSGQTFWPMRYSFVLGAIGILGWGTAILSGTSRMKKIWMLPIVFWVLANYRVVQPRPDLHWPETAARIELERKAVPAREVLLTLQPNGYTQIPVIVR